MSSACGSFSFPAHRLCGSYLSTVEMKKPMSNSRSSIAVCQRLGGRAPKWHSASTPSGQGARTAGCRRTEAAALPRTRMQPHTACMGPCSPIPPLPLETKWPHRVERHILLVGLVGKVEADGHVWTALPRLRTSLEAHQSASSTRRIFPDWLCEDDPAPHAFQHPRLKRHASSPLRRI